MLPGWEQYDPHDLPQHLFPGLDFYSADAAEPVTTAASDELDDLGDDLICLSECGTVARSSYFMWLISMTACLAFKVAILIYYDRVDQRVKRGGDTSTTCKLEAPYSYSNSPRQPFSAAAAHMGQTTDPYAIM